jgi:hypothetical protein
MDTKRAFFDQLENFCKSFLGTAVLLDECTARFKVQCANAEHYCIENLTIRRIKRTVDEDVSIVNRYTPPASHQGATSCLLQTAAPSLARFRSR